MQEIIAEDDHISNLFILKAIYDADIPLTQLCLTGVYKWIVVVSECDRVQEMRIPVIVASGNA